MRWLEGRCGIEVHLIDQCHLGQTIRERIGLAATPAANEHVGHLLAHLCNCASTGRTHVFVKKPTAEDKFGSAYLARYPSAMSDAIGQTFAASLDAPRILLPTRKHRHPLIISSKSIHGGS